MLKPDIDERTWSRFRWYAGLVHEMNGQEYTDISVYRSTWHLLASRLR